MAILARGVKLSELPLMSEKERRERVGELFKAATSPIKEQLEQQKNEIDDQIHFFESQYKMSSEQMKRLLAEEKISETADFCKWLILLKIRERFNREP